MFVYPLADLRGAHERSCHTRQYFRESLKCLGIGGFVQVSVDLENIVGGHGKRPWIDVDVCAPHALTRTPDLCI